MKSNILNLFYRFSLSAALLAIYFKLGILVAFSESAVPPKCPPPGVEGASADVVCEYSSPEIVREATIKEFVETIIVETTDKSGNKELTPICKLSCTVSESAIYFVITSQATKQKIDLCDKGMIAIDQSSANCGKSPQTPIVTDNVIAYAGGRCDQVGDALAKAACLNVVPKTNKFPKNATKNITTSACCVKSLGSCEANSWAPCKVEKDSCLNPYSSAQASRDRICDSNGCRETDNCVCSCKPASPWSYSPYWDWLLPQLDQNSNSSQPFDESQIDLLDLDAVVKQIQ